MCYVGYATAQESSCVAKHEACDGDVSTDRAAAHSFAFAAWWAARGRRRRRATSLGRGLLVLLLLLAGQARAQGYPIAFEQVADGAYMVRAPGSAPAPGNRGFVGNLGVVVGASGAVLVGTGTGDAFGEQFVEAVERRFGKPVVLAVNLQATPDHVLGNTALARRGVPILAHRETDRFMLANCPKCIQRLSDAAGAAAVAGSALSRPTWLIDHGERFSAGGRALEVLHFGATFQPGSLVLLDRETGVLFAGDMAGVEQVPELRNADPRNWMQALAALQSLPLRRVVPAHGPAAAPSRLADTAAYLRGLWDEVGRAYRGGATIQEAARLVELPRFRAWMSYDTLHASNVHFVYLRIEAEDLAR